RSGRHRPGGNHVPIARAVRRRDPGGHRRAPAGRPRRAPDGGRPEPEIGARLPAKELVALTRTKPRRAPNRATMTRRFLTPQEVAALLRVSPAAIRRLLHRGVLPAVRVGRAWRVE